MSALSDYAENALLDHILGTSAFTMPTNVYVALYSVAPTDAGGGTEVGGGSYARQAATFNAASGGSADTDALVTFSGMPTVTVVAVGIFDASSGGNLLLHGTLAASKSYTAGATAEFAIGDLIVTLA